MGELLVAHIERHLTIADAFRGEIDRRVPLDIAGKVADQCGDEDREVAEVIVGRGVRQISRAEKHVVVGEGIELLDGAAYLALGDDAQQSRARERAEVVIERGLGDVGQQLAQLARGELAARQRREQAHAHGMQDQVGASGCHCFLQIFRLFYVYRIMCWRTDVNGPGAG